MQALLVCDDKRVKVDKEGKEEGRGRREGGERGRGRRGEGEEGGGEGCHFVTVKIKAS